MRPSSPTIYWVGETGRLAWYSKYALMRTAGRHALPLEQITAGDAADFGIPAGVETSLRGCHGLVVIEWEGRRCSLIVDLAEGFFFVSPAMQHVDLYLCSAYHPDLFSSRELPEPFAWQSQEARDTLAARYKNTVDACGAWFDKIQPYIPMPMSLHFAAHRQHLRSWLMSRFFARTMRRGPRAISRQDAERRLFDVRYGLLESYRTAPLRYDVVARDTFWASPWHRAQLHEILQSLSSNRKIVRELREVSRAEDVAWLRAQLAPDQWRRVEPLLHAHGTFDAPFEQMMASARLNVHAVGKHWGWREIGFLSMLCGMPILMDRPKFMPYCGLDDFEIWFTEGDWSEVPNLLDSISDSRWAEIRRKNQAAFDRHFSPDAVGAHIVRTAMAHMGATADEIAWLNS
jgi:hypothetical protein